MTGVFGGNNMATLSIILIAAASAALIWYLVATMLIYENLRKRGEKVSLIWLRALSPWYAGRYREITRRETGKTGPLFYHYVVSINGALLFIVLSVLIQ